MRTAAEQPRVTTAGNESFVSRFKVNRTSVLLGITILLIVALAAVYYLTPGGARAQPIDSIAVLPFANAGGDPNTDYLSDGITESIINSLSQLPQLKVMARSTVFHFKGRDTDARAVGKELGVRAVLTGRLSQQGDNLLISAELVNVSDGAQLWGEQYNRRKSDLAVLQQDISREITDRLRFKLSGEQQRRRTGRPRIRHGASGEPTHQPAVGVRCVVLNSPIRSGDTPYDIVNASPSSIAGKRARCAASSDASRVVVETTS